MSKLAALCNSSSLPLSSLSPSRQQLFTCRSLKVVSLRCTSTAKQNCGYGHIRSYTTVKRTIISSSLSSSSSSQSHHIQSTTGLKSRATAAAILTSTSKLSITPRPTSTKITRHFSTTTKTNLDIKIPIYDPNRPASRGWRLAYFGSDHFSQIVLKALNEVKSTKPNLIEYIKVYGLPEGRSGRGMINERINPVREYVSAEPGPTKMSITMLKNGLMDYDASIAREDLLVVVSFGHFIPASMIDSFPHGGINVHPSLLPSYRGPAPIMHAIWNKEKFTGVTVQTLDKKKFDHGNILAQSEEIAIDPYINYGKKHPPFPQPGSPYKELSDRLASEGAKLLLKVLRERLRDSNLRTTWGRHMARLEGEDQAVLKRYDEASTTLAWGEINLESKEDTAPALKEDSAEVGTTEIDQKESPYPPSQAPKLDDRFNLIRIGKESAEDTYRRSLIVPKMFAFPTTNDALAQRYPPSYEHWFFIGIRIFSNELNHEELKDRTPGEFVCLRNKKTKEKVMVLVVKDGEFVTVDKIHVEGRTPVNAGEWAFSRERAEALPNRIRFCTDTQYE